MKHFQSCEKNSEETYYYVEILLLRQNEILARIIIGLLTVIWLVVAKPIL